MAAKFHERFDIEVGIEEARRRFVNRAQNLIFASLEESHMERDKVAKQLVLTGLGDKIPREPYSHLSDEVGEDFYRNLEALELGCVCKVYITPNHKMVAAISHMAW